MISLQYQLSQILDLLEILKTQNNRFHHAEYRKRGVVSRFRYYFCLFDFLLLSIKHFQKSDLQHECLLLCVLVDTMPWPLSMSSGAQVPVDVDVGGENESISSYINLIRTSCLKLQISPYHPCCCVATRYTFCPCGAVCLEMCWTSSKIVLSPRSGLYQPLTLSTLPPSLPPLLLSYCLPFMVLTDLGNKFSLLKMQTRSSPSRHTLHRY
jgi:hypothetical protein